MWRSEVMWTETRNQRLFILFWALKPLDNVGKTKIFTKIFTDLHITYMV